MKTATYRFSAVGSLLWTLCAFVPNATAQSPKEQLQGTIDRVIEILRTISSPQDIEKHKTSLRRLLIARFDFAAMAQKSLGSRWSDLAGDEQAFVATFTDFVQHGYMSTLGSYRGEKVGL
ncbi:MAG TPA: ABC transporter substrate-binding protein [Candidatus Binatia bacterium]|nr:ABC transporter substrate-binding protein [Candidatus Binatia bacterium]